MKSINAIIARFSYDYSEEAIEKSLREHPFNFCGIISTGVKPKYFSVLPEQKQEWFSSSWVRGCIYKNVNWSSLESLDEELIEQMRECEAIFMDMVARLEWKREVPYSERKQWYYKHLRFWNDYIKRHKINLYISAWIPHEIPDIVIYYLCKLRGIPVLYFNTCTIHDTSFAEHDISKSAYQIGDRYKELLEEYKNEKDPGNIKLGERFQSYFDALISPVGRPPELEKIKRLTYWGHVRNLLWRKPVKFIKFGIEYFTPKGIARFFNTLHRNRAINRYEKFYDSRATLPDLNKPFVYVPLHYQPEASTNPMGGCFRNQSLMIQILNANLPDDVLIYVKEHPRKGGWLQRSVDFYKELLSLKKVRFVPSNFKTFELREHCSVVATVTGTAGFEALFLKKPVFLFGHRFYQYANGVFRINSSDDCKKATKAIFEDRQTPKPIESKIYLKAMEDTCINGIFDPWKMKVTKMNYEDHVKATSAAIFEEIKKLEKEIEAVSY